LNTSVPRRTPPSTNTVDRAAQRLVGAAAVVAHDDAVDAMLEAERGVLARLNALEQHLHLRDALEPVHRRPAMAGHAHAHLGHVDAVKHAPHQKRVRGHRRVAGLADRIVVAVETAHRREVARRDVDGPRDGRAACVLGALQQSLVRGPVRQRVELQPARRAARGGHVLDGQARDRREHLQSVLRLRGTRDGHFAFGVEHLLCADGAEEDRCVEALAEHFHREIHVPDVDEPARPQAELLERRAVRRDRAEVVGALGDVGVVARVQRLADRGLEVPDVDGFLGARDDASEIERAGKNGVVLRARSGGRERAAEACEQRALGEKPQELSPRRGANVVRHGTPPGNSAANIPPLPRRPQAAAVPWGAARARRVESPLSSRRRR
jgi:hypothetical protein